MCHRDLYQVENALGLTQEEFAARYRIPVGTLRDWEEGRVQPDEAAQAYLMVIAREPGGAKSIGAEAGLQVGRLISPHKKRCAP